MSCELTASPEPSLSAFVSEPCLHPGRHISVGQPWRISDHYISPSFRSGKSKRAAQVAKHVSPDMISAGLAKNRQILIGSLQRGNVPGIRDVIAPKPCAKPGSLGRRGLSVLDHRMYDCIKAGGVFRDVIRETEHRSVRHLNPYFAPAKKAFGVPLQTITEIDRDISTLERTGKSG